MAIWKTIEHYSRYEISDDGRVRNISTGKLLAHNMNSTGYKRVSIYSDSARKYKQALLHRLVAAAFVPQLQGKDTVNHIDGDKTNNAPSNLEWVTRSENMIHAYSTGLSKRKLSHEDCAAIRSVMQGAIHGTAVKLARKYGVDPSRIRQIAK